MAKLCRVPLIKGIKGASTFRGGGPQLLSTRGDFTDKIDFKQTQTIFYDACAIFLGE